LVIFVFRITLEFRNVGSFPAYGPDFVLAGEALGARILSMSEAQLRKMISSDPAIAARLLLNISKMLCLRLLKDR
jgi:hypothetical protein